MEDLDYLVDTYLNKEHWHQTKLSEEQSRAYFQKLLDNDNVVLMRIEGKPVGYLSIWWLDQRQLTRLYNGEEFHAADENITDGDFVFVSGAYLEKKYRGKGNIKILNQMMKDTHKDKDYVGIVYEDAGKGKFVFNQKGEL